MNSTSLLMVLFACTTLIAFTRAGIHFAAILVSPLALGCTPSLKSDVLKPVYWSTTQIGDLVVFFEAAQAGMAAFKA
jgi:hypothetical protein